MVTVEEQMKLDVYGFGTAAFALAKGKEYLENEHPSCGLPVQIQGCECENCRALNGISDFGTEHGKMQIVDLIKKSVHRQALARPSIEELMHHSFFTVEFVDSNGQIDPTVDFHGLLGLEI